MQEGSLFSTSFPACIVGRFLMIAILIGVRWYLIVVLIYGINMEYSQIFVSFLWKGHANCLCIVPILVYVLLKWALSLHFQRRATLCCLFLSIAPIKFFHQLFPHPSSLPVSPPLLYRDSKLSFKSSLTLPLFPNKICCFHGCPSWKHVLQLLHSLLTFCLQTTAHYPLKLW